MERTEEQKLSQAGILVKLGSAEYTVAPLVIRDAREWRKKVVGVLSGISGQPSETRLWKRFINWLLRKSQKGKSYLEATTDNPESFDEALHYLLVSMQDTIIDLFFEYAKDLNRKQIEAEATEEQIEEAFTRVVKVAFPLSQSPTMLKQRLLQ